MEAKVELMINIRNQGLDGKRKRKNKNKIGNQEGEQMNDYLKLLEMLKSSQRLVSVFSDIEEPSTCSVGYIHQFDECWMAMAHITTEGFEDGYIFRKIENIFRIDFDGVYEKKVEYLQNQNLKKHEQLNLCSEKGIFVAAMNEAKRTKKMMAINVLGGDDVIGSVYSIS